MGLKFESVLIVTYGRSGSTLLQGILNSIDGVLVRGENSNMCYHMFKAYKAILYAKNNQSENNEKKPWLANTAQNAWYGCEFLSQDDFLASIWPFVRTSLLADQAENPEIKCLGFKEVRYTVGEIKRDFGQYLQFLERLFPNVAFIFNTRNRNATSDSAWWAMENKKKVKEKLVSTEKRFQNYAKKHPENSYEITYKDIISKSKRLEEMFDFLGATYNSKKVDEILNKQHSYKITK